MRSRRPKSGKYPTQKLTATDVLEIRKIWSPWRDGIGGKYTLTKLARKYGVSPQTIWRAATGETWKHL